MEGQGQQDKVGGEEREITDEVKKHITTATDAHPDAAAQEEVGAQAKEPEYGDVDGGTDARGPLATAERLLQLGWRLKEGMVGRRSEMDGRTAMRKGDKRNRNPQGDRMRRNGGSWRDRDGVPGEDERRTPTEATRGTSTTEGGEANFGSAQKFCFLAFCRRRCKL